MLTHRQVLLSTSHFFGGFLHYLVVIQRYKRANNKIGQKLLIDVVVCFLARRFQAFLFNQSLTACLGSPSQIDLPKSALLNQAQLMHSPGSTAKITESMLEELIKSCVSIRKQRMLLLCWSRIL